MLFKKKWVWFAEPKDISDADSVTYFSYDDVEAPGFRKKEGWTTVIELFKPEEEIWRAMRPRFIAEQIQKGQRKGIVVKQDNNWAGFRELYRSFREHKGIPKDDESLFEKHGLNFSAYLHGELLSSGVFITDRQNIRAWALASKRLDGLDGKKKDIVGQANRLLIWEAIKYGKREGMLRFDLGGIALEENGVMPPLTIFKEAFGGARLKNYYYSKVYSPVLKAVRAAKKFLQRR
ncbi:MAG: hypothetical protein HYV68_03080 [Candidatus Taylorbacteria bacterium]|nr:hypothetical protein [Candidatus Taylorbacteria bacterium]